MPETEFIVPLERVTIEPVVQQLEDDVAAEMAELVDMGRFDENVRDALSREFLPYRISDTLNIEGIRVNARVTKSILDGLAVADYDRYNQQEILNVNDANNYVEIAANSKSPLTPSLIREVHGAIEKGLISTAGVFRSSQVIITGAAFSPPDALFVPSLVQEVCDIYNSSTAPALVSAGWIHATLAKIHPFDDGNGRTARLIQDLVLLERGLLPIGIPMAKRKEYYESLACADAGDFADLIAIMATAELDYIDRAKTIARSHKARTNRLAQLSSKAREQARRSDYNQYELWLRRQQHVVDTFESILSEFNETSGDIELSLTKSDIISFDKWLEIRKKGYARATWVITIWVKVNWEVKYKVLFYARRHMDEFTSDSAEEQDLVRDSVGLFMLIANESRGAYDFHSIASPDPYIGIREIALTPDRTFVYEESATASVVSGVNVQTDRRIWDRSEFSDETCVDLVESCLAKLGIV